MTVILLVAVAAPALAGTAVAADGSLSVGVSQSDDGSATVEVTHNNTSADGAGVTVETVDDNATYDGASDYTTDANGTVELPAPNETVDVSVVAIYENETAETQATLQASATNETNESTFGSLVSSFVHAAHAGPPEDDDRGLSEEKGNGSSNGCGPPDHAKGR